MRWASLRIKAPSQKVRALSSGEAAARDHARSGSGGAEADSVDKMGRRSRRRSPLRWPRRYASASQGPRLSDVFWRR